jgi:hypothetical protein
MAEERSLLGEIMQAFSAFVTVQTAFNWLDDKHPRSPVADLRRDVGPQ